MLFKRSTRAIVTGRRVSTPDAASSESGNGFDSAAEATAADPKSFWQELKETDPRFLVSLVAVMILISVVTNLLFMPRSQTPMEVPAPDIAQGQVIVETAAELALLGQVGAGDIVRLYTADGQPIPQLQYVQVYSADTENGLLLLLDDLQAGVLIGQEQTPRLAVVSQGNVDRAAELTDLQKRINNPIIRLTLQRAAVAVPGTSTELSCTASIDPVEAILPPIEWSTSDPSVATVDGGIVTAHSVGQVTVSAVCGDVTASCTVNIEIPLESIHLDKSECSLLVGATLQLTAAAEPADASNYAAVWTVADSQIATVSEDGTVTGIAPGTTVVTASCGDITAECTVTVGIPAEIVQIDKTALELNVGQTDVLSASVYPSTDVVDIGSWASSDPAIATVSEDGTVTAVAPGTAVITFSCGQATDSCTVQVAEAA